MKKLAFYFPLIFLLFLYACGNDKGEKNSSDRGSKILVIHSYHSDSRRVMEHNASISRILGENDTEFSFFYMDTQRNREEDFIRDAALAARDRIEEYRPDVVITFDDNAFKYVIMPYYRDSDLNVIFAGLDWDVSVYEAPYSNTTGMISVTLMEQLISHLRDFSKGDKVVWLGYDTLTSRKESDAYLNILQIDMEVVLVNSFDEWKSTFLSLQKESDIIVLSGTLTSMKDWKEEEAVDFISSYIAVPLGTVNKSILSCSVMGMVVVPTEQGEWVSNRALEIINGKKVSDIPVTTNKEGEVFLNLDLAEKLDISFSNKLIKSATLYQYGE